MRLVWVELRRLWARRFFWIGAVVLLLGLATVLSLTAYDSRVPTDADLAQARATVAEQTPLVLAQRRRCEDTQRSRQQGLPPVVPTPTPPQDTPPAGTAPPGTAPPDNPPAGTAPATPPLSGDEEFGRNFNCAVLVPPTEDQFLTDNVFRFTDEMVSRNHALTVILALFAYLVGATAVGAEWHHGTLAGLLLWEPRRIRVFVAKLIALLGSLTAVSALGYAASVAGHWAVADLRGALGALTPDFQRDVALAGARGLAVILVGAAAGFAIAFTLRRTAAAMGVAMAYFAIVEIGVSGYFRQSSRWLLTTYVDAWLTQGTQLSLLVCGPDGCDIQRISISMWQGGSYLGALALLLLAVAAAVFRRREVT